jgi:hypothetical protein
MVRLGLCASFHIFLQPGSERGSGLSGTVILTTPQENDRMMKPAAGKYLGFEVIFIRLN